MPRKMNLDEAKEIVESLPPDQQLAMALIAKHLCDRSMVRGYTLGLEHGESGTRVSLELLFQMLDP